MNRFLEHSSLVIGSLTVAGLVSFSGGSAFQSSIAGLVTGLTASTTSTLATRSKASRQKIVDRDQFIWESEGERREFLSLLTTKTDHINDLLEEIIDSFERVEKTFDSTKRSKVLELSSVEEMNGNITEERRKIAIENTGPIVNFLSNKNIAIKAVPEEDATDDIINSLSKLLGENYDALGELLAQIKRNMQKGTRFRISVKGYAQKDISSVCQFCTRLHELAFLKEYHYRNSPQYLILAQATTLSTAQKFFSGQWLERFVLLTVQKCIEKMSLELNRNLFFKYLINPQIVLPNGDDFELDVIFCVDEIFFWIEAKSGDYQQHINKYSKMSKTLNLDYEHSIMVLPDIPESRSDELSALFSMTVCSLSTLEENLTQTIRKDQVT